MKFIITVITSCLVAVLFAIIILSPGKCEHEEMVKVFGFQFQGSTAASYWRKHCKNCDNRYAYPSNPFRGNPTDLSYLEALKEHIDGDEIVGGEYYTVTAIMTLGDYNIDKTRISCKVESNNIIVEFSAEFREEFEDLVDLLKEGDEITFRGKFYEEGCGFTDCELI